MSYGRYLRELLAPLRLYDLEAPFNGGELNVQGGALDGVDTWLAELRREIASYLDRRFGLKYDYASQILVTVGGSEALDLSLRVLLNPGDEVILCALLGELL